MANDWRTFDWYCSCCGFIEKRITLVPHLHKEQRMKIVTCIVCKKRVTRYEGEQKEKNLNDESI